ncbi:MAG: substrate-binding domain-containing protein [Spirochaetales bacterium]|nr:substrate-binding domain-containing protein [Spirochaetales bacterium]
MPTKSRKTIGFLINQLTDRYQALIWPGIVDVVRENGMNLIIFVGKSLKTPYMFENEHTVIYNLVTPEIIDGLIILSGAIGNFVSHDELREFCKQYRPIPMVNIAMGVNGIPTIMVDNKAGMRELVRHFVVEHGYKRIAFVRGPSTNDEAELRFAAYKEVLKENSIPFDPDLVYEGTFIWNSGVEAIKTLLDDRKVLFDACIAANDDMLLGVFQELERRKIAIPGDVALGGFDNIEETRINTPSLTTVMQPLYEQGRKAAELLIKKMAGKKTPMCITLPAKIITRQSCGCKLKSTFINKNNTMDENGPAKELKGYDKIEILYKLQKDIIQQNENPKTVIQYLDKSLDALMKDIKDKKHRYLNLVNKIISSSDRLDFNLEQIKELLTNSFTYLQPFLKDSSGEFYRANAFYQNGQRLLLEAINKKTDNKFITIRDLNWKLRNVTQSLSVSFDFEATKEILKELLPQINIKNCYIALYNDLGKSDVKPYPVSRLFFSYPFKQLSKSNSVFPSNRLLPEQLIKKLKTMDFAVFPLLVKKDHFGFILINFEPDFETTIYETLQGHISASLKGADLFEQVSAQSNNLLRQKEELTGTLNRVRSIMGGFIRAMSLLVETRDPYTAGHQNRVADLARAIASQMELSADQIEAIRIAGILHDVGKIYIPTQILNKPGRLIEEEINLIRIHPKIGFNILKPVDFSWPIAEIVLQHHERLNGSGYPLGLKKEKISIEARIICVADVVEAMSSHRPYRPALGIDKALEEITKNRGSLYDADVVDVCLKLFRENNYTLK